MEIFLEFLKYGAIGIAMVLVVLSYRLLSKEQEKEHVREPMLKSIRNYFVLAIILTLFFGITEILTVAFSSGASGKQNDETEIELKKMYARIFTDSDSQNLASTLQKMEVYLKKGAASDLLESELSSLKNDRDSLSQTLRKTQKTLLRRSITDLEKLVKLDPQNFLNITHEVYKKEEHFELLEIILQSLNKIDTSISDRTERIQKSWEKFKRDTKIKFEGNEDYYIFPSDIKELRKHI